MAITLNGNGVLTGVTTIPDGIVTNDDLAGSIAVSKLATTGSASSSTFLDGSGAWASAGGGVCLQVVQDTLTAVFSTTSTSYAEITGLSVSITPSATSSKILLMGFIGYGGISSANIFMGLFRDSTELLVGDASSSAPRSFAQFAGRNTNSQAGFSPMYLDSPSSTSSLAYTVKTYTEGSAYPVYINRCHEDNGSTMARTASTLMAIEIGA
jgi:hypothetical protein